MLCTSPIVFSALSNHLRYFLSQIHVSHPVLLVRIDLPGMPKGLVEVASWLIAIVLFAYLLVFIKLMFPLIILVLREEVDSCCQAVCSRRVAKLTELETLEAELEVQRAEASATDEAIEMHDMKEPCEDQADGDVEEGEVRPIPFRGDKVRPSTFLSLSSFDPPIPYADSRVHRCLPKRPLILHATSARHIAQNT
jgi:hypothetical protein